ncbi:MAG TPA: MFS transporter [Thermomicrobiales bacterium]|nr:MFS transporter [Thermomicrobiales bacterium]
MSAPALSSRLFPSTATRDARTLITARGMRAFGDGFVTILLPLHLTNLGFSTVQVGLIATATMLGSAALTLLVGLIAYKLNLRELLIRCAILTVITGLGFAFVHEFWPLLLVAFIGTLNPSSGDVSVFLPTEQALLPRTVSDAQRTDIFARYSMAGSLVAAFGALAAGIPEWLERHTGIAFDRAVDGMFLLYAAFGVGAFFLYHRLSPGLEPKHEEKAPLGQSRGIVYRLAALFSLDSFASGIAVQSMIALWLFQKFDLSAGTTGAIFFFAGLLTAVSYLVAARLARRIGLVRTMVFTHLPANGFLMLAPFMPTVQLAVVCLLIRSFLSSMDVPARTSYVMAVVTPAERPAAASVTNVPRSLASAIGPTISGALLTNTTFGWPLLIGGSLKVVYDLTLLKMFRDVKPPEEK